MTLNATLRLRTRTQTATLIEIYEAADSFFQMELLDDRVQVHFNLSGETGTVYSGETGHHSCYLFICYYLLLFHRSYSTNSVKPKPGPYTASPQWHPGRIFCDSCHLNDEMSEKLFK